MKKAPCSCSCGYADLCGVDGALCCEICLKQALPPLGTPENFAAVLNLAIKAGIEDKVSCLCSRCEKLFPIRSFVSHKC